MILILMVEGARAVISFCMRSAIPGYMVVPPDMTEEQEAREYRQMTGNVRRDNEKSKGEEPIKKQLEEVNGFLMLIVQFVVSVVCAFMAGYMGPYLLYGRTDMGSRLLIGIVLGFIVGCADMYFVIRQLLEEDGIKLKKIE